MRTDPYDGSYQMTRPQSLNRYTYLMGDPINDTDPLGLFGGIRLCRLDPNTEEWMCDSILVPIVDQKKKQQRQPAFRFKLRQAKLSQKRLKEFIAFLDSDEGKACRDKLAMAFPEISQDLIKDIKNAAPNVNFIDARSIGDYVADPYIPDTVNPFHIAGRLMEEVFNPDGIVVRGGIRMRIH